MKKFFMIALIGIVLVFLYFGYIHLVSKVLGSKQAQNDQFEQYRAQKGQTERSRDVQEKQRRLMQDRQQRIRDMQRSY